MNPKFPLQLYRKNKWLSTWMFYFFSIEHGVTGNGPVNDLMFCYIILYQSHDFVIYTDNAGIEYYRMPFALRQKPTFQLYSKVTF